MIESTIVAAVVGMSVGVVVARFYSASLSAEVRKDAYEQGWKNGYDVGSKRYVHTSDSATYAFVPGVEAKAKPRRKTSAKKVKDK